MPIDIHTVANVCRVIMTAVFLVLVAMTGLIWNSTERSDEFDGKTKTGMKLYYVGILVAVGVAIVGMW
jgi:hypothetical protein